MIALAHDFNVCIKNAARGTFPSCTVGVQIEGAQQLMLADIWAGDEPARQIISAGVGAQSELPKAVTIFEE